MSKQYTTNTGINKTQMAPYYDKLIVCALTKLLKGRSGIKPQFMANRQTKRDKKFNPIDFYLSV